MHRYNVRLALCEGREQASCLPQPNPEGLEQSALVLGRTRQRCPLANPRRPIIAGRDPQEVLHDFLVLVKESPFSTLITAWKLLVRSLLGHCFRPTLRFSLAVSTDVHNVAKGQGLLPVIQQILLTCPWCSTAHWTLFDVF